MQVSPKEILKEFWGYSSFRPLQEEIIQSVISGKNTMAILPTGGGKSVCYQVPAMAMEGVCLVVSPLIALMQDQVEHLVNRGINAACIHSALSVRYIEEVIDKAIAGDFKLLYVSPERLETELFIHALKRMNISLVAIDEAHCISQWGHDFRPSYLQIEKIRPFLPPNIPWIALTATATPKVQEEILHYLKISDARVFKQSVFRENLSYQVVKTNNKFTAVVDIFKDLNKTGILYCPTRRKCLEMREWLKNNGIKALAYHAGMPKEERFAIQKQWTMTNDTVVCATSAFGMGIDKEDVAIVAHWAPPTSLEAYYQEAGRAGRNGMPAKCILLYDHLDILKMEELPDIQFPPPKIVKQVYQKVCDYLQIFHGSGYGKYFHFDIIRFMNNVEIDLMRTINAIKILEKSNVWVWDENVFSPSTVEIIAGKGEIDVFKDMEPKLYEVLQALIRLHPGVFSFPVNLQIWEVAQLLDCPQSEIISGLRRLHQMNLIKYNPKEEGGYLLFKQPRCKKDELVLDRKKISFLKTQFTNRLQSILAYLNEEEHCRTVLIGKYFGETDQEPCGYCDTCVFQQYVKPNNKRLRKRIVEKLKESRESSLQNLTSHFQPIKQKDLVEELKYLQNEGFCQILPSGKIILL